MMNCAISGCFHTQATLQSGRLHLIDTPVEATPGQSRKKYVWICPECSLTHVVQTWRSAGEQIQRRKPRPTLPFPVQSETVEHPKPFLLSNAS